MKIFVNLLPPDKKRDLQTGMVMAYVQTMVTILLAVAIIVSGTMFSLKVLLEKEYRHLKNQGESAVSPESADVMDSIGKINSYLKDTDALQEKFIPWTDVLGKIAPLMPERTRLFGFRTDQSNRIFLSGLASTRDEALSLLKSLEEQPYLSDVKSPLSNILQKDDVRFSFEMKYVSDRQDR